MRLYHGTSAEVARKALKEGLKPRGDGASQWGVESGKDRVYLTDAYALYFAANASDNHLGIVEVDTEALFEPNLVPDEDFLEQATRGKPSDCPADITGVHERTYWFRDNAWAYQPHWRASIKHMGTCAHIGKIHPRAITRIAIFDPRSNPDILFKALDPTISIMNYLVVGAKYRALTRWVFDETVPPEDLFDYAFFDMMPGKREDMVAHAEKVTANRGGIEIIENKLKKVSTRLLTAR